MQENDTINNEVVRTVVKDDVVQKVRNVLVCTRGLSNEEELKKAINNFLWRYLPMKTTLREADILACKIFELMYQQ